MPIRENEEFIGGFLGDDEENGLALLRQYQPSINFLSQKLSALTNIDAEDLRSEGMIGLARAIRDFEDTRGAQFRTFALYKIKDAMREFVNTQKESIKIPQYLHDAANLAIKLRTFISMRIPDGEYRPFAYIWQMSKKITEDDEELEELRENIDQIREAFFNLADRSHISVIELAERAEILPALTFASLDDIAAARIFYSEVYESVEEAEGSFINNITNKDMLEELRHLLTEEEFDILYLRFIEGFTIRELAPKYNITPESLVVRTNKILRKAKKRLLRKMRA